MKTQELHCLLCGLAIVLIMRRNIREFNNCECKVMKNIPYILIVTRFILALVILILAYLKRDELRILLLILMYLGLFTDIFDGIIARKTECSRKNFGDWIVRPI